MSGNERILPRRRSIRLPRDIYRQPGMSGLITIATADRRTMFTHAPLANACIDLLKQIAPQQQVRVLGYCFMPDHCHLLLQVDGTVGLTDFVRTFKSRSTRISWTQGYKGSLWQRSFYDHLLRESDDERKHLRYLLDNPVRAGLVDYAEDYPFSGSLVFDLTADEWW